MEPTNPQLDTLLTDWVRINQARGISPRAQATYTLEANIFRAPLSLDRDPLFTTIDHASRYAHSVTLIEHLPSAYVVTCPELTDTATAFPLLGRIAICVPTIPNACWTRANILHELAHIIVGPDRGHDTTWSGVYVDLVRGHLSPRAARRLATGFATMTSLEDDTCISVEKLTPVPACA